MTNSALPTKLRFRVDKSLGPVGRALLFVLALASGEPRSAAAQAPLRKWTVDPSPILSIGTAGGELTQRVRVSLGHCATAQRPLGCS